MKLLLKKRYNFLDATLIGVSTVLLFQYGVIPALVVVIVGAPVIVMLENKYEH